MFLYEFAEKTAQKPDTVATYVRRNKKIFKNHVERRQKQIWLDEKAVDILLKKYPEVQKKQKKPLNKERFDEIITKSLKTLYENQEILAKEIDEIRALVEELEESFDHKQAEQQKEDNGLISLEKLFGEDTQVDRLTRQVREQGEKIRKPESMRSYMTIEEVQALIDTPMPHEEYEIVKCAYLFSCFCGLRISDIIKLKWNDVFVDRGQYRLAVSMKKTKEPIYLPLSPEALKWMPERGGKSSEDNVFDLPSANTIRMQLKPWAKAAGISKRFSYHTSRHTFATMMLTLGADLYTVSKLLGHADVKMTQVYAKIINKKKDEAVNLVNGLFH